MLKTDAASLTPKFAAAKRLPPEITVDPWHRYDNVYVDQVAYSNTGDEAVTMDFTMGSTGTSAQEATNPFTGTITTESLTKDDEATKAATAAHQAGPYGLGEHSFYDGSTVCLTEVNWTISRDVGTKGCAEEVQHIYVDAGKPTMELDGMIYQKDGDIWRGYQREKKVAHYSQRWTSSAFRDGVAGSAAMILDVYQMTVTSAEDVAAGSDSEVLEHDVTMAMAGESSGAWGAVTFIVHPG
jgi:hypothetical protein